MNRNVHTVVTMALVVLGLALGGCRREVPTYEPLKLGAANNTAR